MNTFQFITLHVVHTATLPPVVVLVRWEAFSVVSDVVEAINRMRRQMQFLTLPLSAPQAALVARPRAFCFSTSIVFGDASSSNEGAIVVVYARVENSLCMCEMDT